jgi:hypothetical protein
MADGFLSGLARRALDLREDVGRRGETLRDTAEEYGREGYRRARDYGEEGYRRARDAGGDARGELRRLWSQLEEVVERQVAPRASDYARRAGGYAREGREAAMDAADYLRDATRARPLLAIGIAVAATWLIASLVRGGGGRR